MALARLTERPAAAPSFLATVADEVTREAVRQAAAQFAWSASRIREGGLAAACELLQDAPAPSVLLVDVSDSCDVLAAMDALAEACDPETRVIALGKTNDIGLYRALLRMGVVDYLVKPVSAEVLTETLRRAERPAAAEPASARAARTYAFIGARGGVGSTTLAVSAAWALANERGQKTVLLDLDMQFGAAALSLDLEPGRGLRDILSTPDRIDSLLISSAMAHAGERLRLLSAEEPLEDDIQLGPAGLQSLLKAVGDDCDALVIDVPRRTDALVREVLTRADVVVLVTDLTLPAMRDAQRLHRLIRSLRADGEVLIVGNRLGGVPGETPRAEFTRGVGADLDFAVPADAKAAQTAAEMAVPLIAAGGGKAAGAAELRALAARLCGEAAQAEAPAAPLGWLKRALGR